MSEEIDPLDLGYEKIGNEYFLIYKEQNILCARGIHKISHYSSYLLDLLIQGFVRHGALILTDDFSLKICGNEPSRDDEDYEKKQISLYYLMISDQKHLIEKEPLCPKFPLDLLFDLSLITTCNGPPLEIGQAGLLSTFWSVLQDQIGNDSFGDLHNYALGWYYYNSGFVEIPLGEGVTYDDLSKSQRQKIREDWLKDGPGDLIPPDDFIKKDFAVFFKDKFDGLTTEVKTGLLFLCNLTDYQTILLPLALIKGWLSVSEFVGALSAVGDAMLYRYGSTSESTPEGHMRMYDFGENRANKVLEYISASNRGRPENQEGSRAHAVNDLINMGESKRLEFKSTFRFCLKKKSHQQFISDIIVKSVCAFLNTDSGGTLLVGVADDGKILGLDNDNFKNDDDCQLFFKNRVTSNLGADIIPFVELEITNLKGKSIAVIKIKKATTPIYFKNVFYVRNGPSSDPLDLPDAVNYIREHFD